MSQQPGSGAGPGEGLLVGYLLQKTSLSPLCPIPDRVKEGTPSGAARLQTGCSKGNIRLLETRLGQGGSGEVTRGTGIHPNPTSGTGIHPSPAAAPTEPWLSWCLAPASLTQIPIMESRSQ